MRRVWKRLKSFSIVLYLLNFEFIKIFYLVSSDTDLLPAIEITKEEKKKVVYVGFENFISHALINNCSSYKILSLKDIKKFKSK